MSSKFLSQTKNAISARKYRSNLTEEQRIKRNFINSMYNQFIALARLRKSNSVHCYTPTGYSKGRPRKGEIRPITPGGAHQSERRAKLKDSEEYKSIQAMYQQFWKLANYDRSKEIARNSRRRKKSWKESQGKIKVQPI